MSSSSWISISVLCSWVMKVMDYFKSRPFCQRLYVIIFCIPTSSTTAAAIIIKLLLRMRIFVVPLVEHKRFSVGISTVLRHRDHGKASETQRHKESLLTLSRPYSFPILKLSHDPAWWSLEAPRHEARQGCKCVQAKKCKRVPIFVKRKTLKN